MNFKLNTLIPDHIRELKPYASARDEYSNAGGNMIFLDANEQPQALPGLPEDINRYPRATQINLLERLAAVKGLPVEQVICGNGSDELIDLILSCFTTAGQDQVMVFPPTFGMYEVRARVHKLGVKHIPLSQDFEIITQDTLAAAENTKLMFVCHPNNPSANLQPMAGLHKLLTQYRGIVVVDEAYIDFCPTQSLLPLLDQYPNLIVLQTMSKAWGMAGARIGMAFASREIIAVMNKVRLPYNLGTPSAQLALQALNSWAEYKLAVRQTIRRREELVQQLAGTPGVIRVYPSETNFLLVKTADAEALYTHLLGSGIVVRNRSKEQHCEGCLRISIGTDRENEALLNAWKSFGNSKHQKDTGIQAAPALADRTAAVQRRTAETSISISVCLDGKGRCDSDTGVGFLDHMLHQIARHGGIDLEVAAEGDLHVDTHHTIEDTAIALGQAIRKALGDKTGIERYGFELPMDESHAKVLIDFGGRSYFKWDVHFGGTATGGIPNSLFPHFFRSFAEAAACNLHIKARGDDDHHIIEAIFKAFAKAMKMAVSRNLSGILPSTKEIL